MPAPSRALAVLLASAAAAGAMAAGATARDKPVTPPVVDSPNANASLACVAPSNAAGIDAILIAAGSPMAGLGDVIVEVSSRAGIDPRFIVAIAAHETMLGTYGPARRIHNPFGLGPGMVFASEADAVRFAVDVLARYYIAEGRDTIATIGAKWAPVGAKNDPGGLNQHWTNGVSGYYATLGGDPALRPLLADQAQVPSCGTGGGGLGDGGLLPPIAPEPPSVGEGPPVVSVWGGNRPSDAQAATIDGFAFPLAIRAGGEARYASAECDGPGPCTVSVTTAPMTHVVASVEGRLIAGTTSERSAGIAFWVVRSDGHRVGYGPLASYAPGISHGARVGLGQPLGQTTGSLDIAWTRAGSPMDPYPMMAATRPPDAEPSPTS